MNRGEMRGSPPYWTPERLEVLRSILNEVARYDRQGAYFGEVSLSAHACERAAHKDLKSDRAVINRGLRMLVMMGIMEGGKRGPKSPGSGYKRRYYPDKPEITPADTDRYRSLQNQVFDSWRRRR